MLKRILIGLLLLIIVAPLALYFGSLDWSKKHSNRVANLPLFSDQINTGQCRLQANGFEFLARVAGMQNKGQAVVLLHGFPESSLLWEPLMHQLAQAGYRVLAFDQRGYSPGARPTAVADYDLTKLSSDVMAVADVAGFDSIHLVGHDWGAAVGWKTVMDNPNRIKTYTALSVAHIGAFFDGVVNDTIQAKRSGYFKFFKMPYLPEFLFTYAGQRGAKKLLAALPIEQQTEYLSILAEPYALTAELNWYRAMDVEGFVKSKVFEQNILCPTLFMWGKKDGVIASSVIDRQQRFIKEDFKIVALDAGHNLMQEKERQVVAEILEQLKKRK